MTREHLRELSIKSIDRVLAHPVLSGIGDEERSALQGWQQFIRMDPGENLDHVLGLMGERKDG